MQCRSARTIPYRIDDGRMRKRGRPRLDLSSTMPSAAVHLKLSAADYDEADRIRRENRERSIQEVIRRGLRRLIEDERGNSL